MRELLDDLNAAPGIRGSLLMTDDGMVATSALAPGLEEETVAALASGLLGAWKRALRAAGRSGALREVVLGASHGRLVFVDVGGAYLVAVTERGTELAPTLTGVRSAASKIRGRRMLAPARV